MEERAKKSTGRTGPQPASRLPAHDRRAIRLVREADVILDAAAKAASESQTHYQRMAAATEELADALDAIMEPLLAVVMPDKAALERGALAVKAFLEAVEKDGPKLSGCVRRCVLELTKLTGEREVPGLDASVTKRARTASQALHGLRLPDDLRAQCEVVLARMRTVYDLVSAGVDPWPDRMAGLLLGNLESMGPQAHFPKELMQRIEAIKASLQRIPEPRGAGGGLLRDQAKREMRYEGLPALAVETDKVVALVWQLASTGRVTLPSDTAAMLRSVQEGYSSMLDAAFAALEACDGLSPIVGEAKQAMARGLSAAKEVAEVVLPLAHFRTGLDLEEPNGAPGAEAGDKEPSTAGYQGGERDDDAGSPKGLTQTRAQHNGSLMRTVKSTATTSGREGRPKDPAPSRPTSRPRLSRQFLDLPAHLHPKRIRWTRAGAAAIGTGACAGVLLAGGVGLVVYFVVGVGERASDIIGVPGIGYAAMILGLALLAVSLALVYMHRRVVANREAEWDAWQEYAAHLREKNAAGAKGQQGGQASRGVSGAMGTGRGRLSGARSKGPGGPGVQASDATAGWEPAAGEGHRARAETGVVVLESGDVGEEVLEVDGAGDSGGEGARASGGSRRRGSDAGGDDNNDAGFWRGIPEPPPPLRRHEHFDAELSSLAMTLGVGRMTEPDLVWIVEELAGSPLPRDGTDAWTRMATCFTSTRRLGKAAGSRRRRLTTSTRTSSSSAGKTPSTGHSGRSSGAGGPDPHRVPICQPPSLPQRGLLPCKPLHHKLLPCKPTTRRWALCLTATSHRLHPTSRRRQPGRRGTLAGLAGPLQPCRHRRPTLPSSPRPGRRKARPRCIAMRLRAPGPADGSRRQGGVHRGLHDRKGGKAVPGTHWACRALLDPCREGRRVQAR